jgi:hypothetical protein
VSVPTADKLRLLLRRDAEAAADLLDAIDALPDSEDRPFDSADYWVIGFQDAMRQVKALLHPKEARRER